MLSFPVDEKMGGIIFSIYFMSIEIETQTQNKNAFHFFSKLAWK